VTKTEGGVDFLPHGRNFEKLKNRDDVLTLPRVVRLDEIW